MEKDSNEPKIVVQKAKAYWCCMIKLVELSQLQSYLIALLL